MTKNALFRLGAVSLFVAWSLLAGGCGKSAAPTPTSAEAQAAPTPTPDALFDGKDIDTDKLRDKANKAANSIGKYLEGQDPKLRDKFQRLSNKLTEQLDKDKGRWREKLEAKRHELEPQIEKLRERLAQQGGEAKDKIQAQLSELQNQSDTTDQKISKLQSLGADAWKKFKKELKADAAKDRTPPKDEDDTDTPTPAPQS